MIGGKTIECASQETTRSSSIGTLDHEECVPVLSLLLELEGCVPVPCLGERARNAVLRVPVPRIHSPLSSIGLERLTLAQVP